jgi:hypothetical protein
MSGLSIEQGIQQVYNGLSHVVILGAGASIAATRRNGEPSGKHLPSMDNFTDVVGLRDIIAAVPEHLRAFNFEKLYSNLHNDNPHSEILAEIEGRIQAYFSGMELPAAPTIYDYLVLALRGKDLIATFNWDPFLYQAFIRNQKFTRDLPRLSFLHGNVAIGYCEEIEAAGPAGYPAGRNGETFVPTQLLYPIEKKNYTNDTFIQREWGRLKWWMGKDSGSVRATIFGYGAPVSDVEAVKLLNDAWGTSDDRNMEQFEIIDISPEEQLRARWDSFIHSHHYDTCNDYFRSSLALNPRRTCESYHSHYLPMTPAEAFRLNNPVPATFKTLEELWQWHEPLIAAEQKVPHEQ